MRIAFSGTQCIGKSTLVSDFLQTWPQYSRSKETYRTVIRDKKLPLNKEVTPEGQWEILNCIVDDILSTSSEDCVVFDRCALDNLVYSLWAVDKGVEGFDKEFIDKCIPLVKESMKYIDIIFLIPITKADEIAIEERETRDIDPIYRHEIDNIFKAIEYQLMKKGISPFFDTEDRPPIIEVFGKPHERIEMLKWYVSLDDGNIIETQESVLNDENLKQMEELLNIQKGIVEEEEKVMELRKEFKRLNLD